ncbi:MAG: hypothetical protein GY769_18375 [bacterium]|nr:hypothetical protein [bacterium]
MTMRRGRGALSAKLSLCVAAVLLPAAASAGSFVFAGEANGLDVITHPPGYTGVGGVLDVEVCIDSTAANAALMAIPVQNIVFEINNMTASTPNLLFGGNNNIPAGVVDFESLTLHELGHCTGLAHPNLGFEMGVVEGANTNFTQATDGANNMFAFDAGVDTVIGTSDDQRGDDQNLHWFEKLVNNPCIGVANPESSNYSRLVADLPGGHDFAANASRDVCSAVSVADTEAVMQQGQGSDEDQRSLQADDVATYRMGMTGLDEIAGTADDYTINMVYGGIKADTSGCDIVIRSATTGFGSCSFGGSFIGASDHIRMTNPTFSYNSNLTWFFNQVLNSGCSVGDIDLTFTGTHNNTQNHEACNSITYGPSYTVGASGVVTATAPSVILANGTMVIGQFTADSSVP